MIMLKFQTFNDHHLGVVRIMSDMNIYYQKKDQTIHLGMMRIVEIALFTLLKIPRNYFTDKVINDQKTVWLCDAVRHSWWMDQQFSSVDNQFENQACSFKGT